MSYLKNVKIPFVLYRNSTGIPMLDNSLLVNYDYDLEFVNRVGFANIEVHGVISKSSLVMSYMNDFSEKYKDLIDDFELLLDKSRLKGSKLTISVEDLKPKLNPDPFEYDSVKNGQPTDVLGETMVTGKWSLFGSNSYVDGIYIKLGMQSSAALVHEIGHAVDLISGYDGAYDLSEDESFDNCYDAYIKELHRLAKLNDCFTRRRLEYPSRRPEVFARLFHQFYDNEVQCYRPHSDIYTSIKHMGETLEDMTAMRVYNQPLVRSYFIKHFGGIIPPENTKHFNKQKWNELHGTNGISDNDLLNKLKQVELDSGLGGSVSLDREIGD